MLARTSRDSRAPKGELSKKKASRVTVSRTVFSNGCSDGYSDGFCEAVVRCKLQAEGALWKCISDDTLCVESERVWAARTVQAL